MSKHPSTVSLPKCQQTSQVWVGPMLSALSSIHLPQRWQGLNALSHPLQSPYWKPESEGVLGTPVVDMGVPNAILTNRSNAYPHIILMQ